MTPARWLKIDTLLHEALKRPPAQRAAFLNDACAGDEDNRREIESLMSFNNLAKSFLEVPAFEAAAGIFADQGQSSIGLVAGAYRIEREIGAGGMGTVYLAEDPKLGRKVAIKFLPPYLETDELAKRRLIREAKAAARLEHPNICAIYEVGEAANGSFIAMQYVDGETLGSLLKNHPPTLGQAVDLAIQVADALIEAHSHGIIHRDIKPPNLVITRRGQVKVLDFGLAKLIQPREASQDGDSRESLLSMPGLIVGTAPYMSPEQAKGEAVDGRSDLFSLGVVLYECVAGKRPFAGSSWIDVCGQVINHDPPPPSQINPRVPPALDALILKALAKDPAARQQSADELLTELRRARALLSDEIPPTLAMPRQIGASRARGLHGALRIVRRPRVFLPAALLAFLLVSLPFWWPATPHQPSLEALRWYEMGTAALRDGTCYKATKALEQAVRLDDRYVLAHARLAEAWTELDYADRARDEILRARSLVSNLPTLPQLDSLRLQAIANTVLRNFDRAIEDYRRIVEESPVAQKASAYVDLGRAQEKNEDIAGAIESYEQAARLDTQDPAALLHLGILYGRRQELGAAGNAFQEAERLYQALFNFEGVTEVCYQRGFLYKNLNRLADARAQLEAALNTAGISVYQQIRAQLVLSSVSAAEGNAAEADREASEAIQKALDNRIENQATSGLIWLGNSFLLRGEYNDAEKSYRRALDFAKRDNGYMNEAVALFSLGSLRSQQRNTDEALNYIEQAIRFFEKGDYRKWLSTALILLGRINRDRGDYSAALRAFDEQLQLGQRTGDLSQLALSHQESGSVLTAQEEYSDALTHFDESCSIKRSLNVTVSLGYSLMYRGGVLAQLGRYPEARAALDEASSIAERSEGAYKELLANIYLARARLELSGSRFRDSLSSSRRSLDLADVHYQDIAVQAKITLGLAEARSGERRLGSQACAEAVELATSIGDPQLLSSALLASAETMLETGEVERALETALRAQERFAHYGQQDSEWRAWLIAAEAKQRLGDVTAAREYAVTAETRLSNLAQKWGPEAYNGYLARSDIRYFRRRLGQLTTI